MSGIAPNPLNDISKVYLEAVAAKPDFLDLDKDGNKKEPMKKAAKEVEAPKERLKTDRNMFNVPKDEQKAAKERLLAKARAKRAKMSEGLDPVGQEDNDPDNDGIENDPNDKYIMKRRKAIAKAMKKRMKEEKELAEVTKMGIHAPHEVPSGNLKGLVKKAVKRVDADNDGDVDKDDPKEKGMGEFVPSPDGKKKVRTKMAESRSNWRQDLSEVMTDEIDSKPIKEKKVNNKIKINPKLGEAIEALGGTLIEMVELDEETPVERLDRINKEKVAARAAAAKAEKQKREKSAAEFQAHKKEVLAKGGRPVDALDSWQKKKMKKEEVEIGDIIESVYDELVEEGYSQDEVEYGIDVALNTLEEGYYDSAVAASKAKSQADPAPKRSLKDRIKSVAKKAITRGAYAAGKAAKTGAKVAAAPGRAKAKVKSLADRVKQTAKAGYKAGRGSEEPSAAHTKTRSSSTYRGAGVGRKETVGSAKPAAKKAEKPADPWEGSATKPKAKTTKVSIKKKKSSKLDDLLASVRNEEVSIDENVATGKARRAKFGGIAQKVGKSEVVTNKEKSAALEKHAAAKQAKQKAAGEAAHKAASAKGLSPAEAEMRRKAAERKAARMRKEEVEQLNERPYQVMGYDKEGGKEKKVGKPVKSRKYADARAAELSDTHKKTGGKYRSQYVEGVEQVDRAKYEKVAKEPAPKDDKKLAYQFKDNKRRQRDLKKLARLVRHADGMRKNPAMYDSFEAEGEMVEGIGMTMAGAIGNPPTLSKRMKLKQALLNREIKKNAAANKKKSYSGKAATKEEVVDEKLNLKKADMGDVIKDFYKSDAPQFKGRSKEKRRQMAIAAKLTAERGGRKLGEGATEVAMSPQELALQKRKTMIDQMIARKRQQALQKSGQKKVNEEQSDRARDERQMRGGMDGNVDYSRPPVKKKSNAELGIKPGKTAVQKELEKKYGKGKSAMDIVKAEIRAKHGKGSLK